MRRFFSLLAAFVVVLASCSSSDDDTATDPPAPDAEQDVVDGGDVEAEEEDTEADSGDDAESGAEDGDTQDESAEASDEPEPDPEVEPTFDFSGVDPIIEAFIAERDLNGAALVVAHRDLGVVDERYWGVFDADRVSLIASSSKMVVASVLLALDDAGQLDIDAPIADVLPYAGDHPEITAAQLLSNSSGLPGLLDTANYGPYLCAFSHLGSLQECAEGILTTPEDDADVIAPDSEFDYGGVQWQVAGAVAEAASGKSWAELVDEILVQPCGLETFGFNNPFSQVEGAGFSHPPGFDNNP